MARIQRTETKPPVRRLVTIADAAYYSACAAKTIRRRISDGTIPAYRFGKRSLRVDLNDVDDALVIIPTTAVGRARRAS